MITERRDIYAERDQGVGVQNDYRQHKHISLFDITIASVNISL